MIPGGSDVRVRVAGILREEDRLLLISHKKDGNVYWLLPGGGVNFGETVEEALKREFREELNILIKTGEVAYISDSIDPSCSRHIINICFFCSYVSGEYCLGQDKRLHGYGFFSEKEVADIRLYPPVNSSLVSIMRNEETPVYLGRLWLDE